MKSSESANQTSRKKTSMNESVYPFDTDRTPELSQVGGKGLSLVLMTQQGLPVPPGFVLSVSFFEPWLEHIRKTPEWDKFLSSSEILKQNCDALKKVCMSLELDDTQKEILRKALIPLKDTLFSVRSSSPEEDLEGASFAGGYETTLGVTEEALEDAVKRSFASLFDHRVFTYKKEHGFNVYDPRIAVIVQKQIASETAGVAFSLNPLNNCYDEAVITGNFGLGESVVSGRVSPDTFVVDKVSHTIVERKTGKKETSIWLAPDGGTYEKAASSQGLCLSDEKVRALTDILVKVEEYYKTPTDIEWAFSNGHVYLLQARPITAYIPLPEKMLTPPGEQKRLYLDMVFAKQGIHEPMSVLGTDYMAEIQRILFKDMMGTSDILDVDGLAFTLEGRSYINISANLKLQGKKRVAGLWRSQDTLAAAIIENLNTEYVPEKLPPKVKKVIPGIVLYGLDAGLKTLKAFINPAEYKKWFYKETEKLLIDLKSREKGSIKEIAHKNTVRYVQFVNHVSLPVTYAAEVARVGMKRIFRNENPEIRDRVVYLERALPENITLEMGLAMYELSQFKDIQECTSGEEFAARIKERTFSEEFLSAYDSFMEEYGFRCPRELDAATPRPYERPAEFFEQLYTMALNTSDELNPQAIYDTSRAEREETYEELLRVARKKGWLAYRLFKWFYHVLVEFGGYREIHKYYYIMTVDAFRRQVLAAAQPLFEEGRLCSVEQVFDLTVDDLETVVRDPSVDVQSLAEKNTQFLRKIKDIHDFPRLIDSRGRILYPPKREAAEGELVGEPISPGVVRGKVKVLLSPDEKPVLPGEILVATATDPGWTPLFINAGGVILEVGGLLQHGALVAREYGKPCVAGIQDVTSLLKDGQIVEIDGLHGVVQVVK